VRDAGVDLLGVRGVPSSARVLIGEELNVGAGGKCGDGVGTLEGGDENGGICGGGDDGIVVGWEIVLGRPDARSNSDGGEEGGDDVVARFFLFPNSVGDGGCPEDSGDGGADDGPLGEAELTGGFCPFCDARLVGIFRSYGDVGSKRGAGALGVSYF